MNRWERLFWKAIVALLAVQTFLAMLAVEKAALSVVKAIEPYAQ